MARQIIDIGVQGNDGTGDSIRESFRKVNDNFQQIFSIFGRGETIAFTDLDDTPDSYSSNQMVVSDAEGTSLVTKNLVGGDGILIDHSDPDQITVISTGGKLINDSKPQLGNHLNASNFGIAQVRDPSTELVSLYNDLHGVSTSEDDFVISRGYADRRYILSGAESGNLGQLRTRLEPQNNQEYFKFISDWIGGYAQILDHGFNTSINGSKFVYKNSGAVPATGLVNDQICYVRYVDQNRLGIYANQEDARLDTSRILVNIDPYVSPEDRGEENLVDGFYDPSLQGFWLSNEALPRQSVVRRQGDKMDGDLILFDHPEPLKGLNIEQTNESLQAVTKFYVDSSSYASTVNLFVSTSGNDNQPNTPETKQGRALSYAFASVNKACQKAEELINQSQTEPGPYRQRITYSGGVNATLNDIGINQGNRRTLQIFTNSEGVDQTININNRDLREGSIIKGIYSGATGNVISYNGISGDNAVYVIDLLHKISDFTVFEANYVLSSNKLIANKQFIQDEVVAFVNTKYPSLDYNPVLCSRDIGFIIDALIEDIKFGSNKNTIKSARAYFQGATGLLPSSQLSETLDAINYSYLVIEQVVQNNLIADYAPPLDGTDTPNDVRRRSTQLQDISGNPGEINSLGLLRNLIDIVLDIVENGPVSENYMEFILGEPLEYGQPVPEVQISIFVESGIYYEQLPIRVPTNVSIKGDEFRRSIIRPAPGQSLSIWANQYFYRDHEFDGLTRTYISDPGAAVALINNEWTITVQSTLGLETDMYLKVIAGNGQLDETTQVKKIINSTSFTINLEPINIAFGAATVIRGLNNTNLSPIGENFAYHYLIDPSNQFSKPKQNKDMDMFLLNDGTILRNITAQGHGGFMCVLDPTGQIQTKSPYFQTCTSLSGSINRQRFAGGMLIDGFCGNLEAEIIGKDSNTQVQLGGLIKRKPQVPSSFFIDGNRYQINTINSYDSNLGTATVILDEFTPYVLPITANVPIVIGTPGNRSMLANDFTQINDLGYGCIALNNGISELVSVFSYYCWTSYYSVNGGQIRSVAGNSSYGEYGLRSKGRDPNEVPDQVILGDNVLQQAKIYKKGSLSSKSVAGEIGFYIDHYTSVPVSISEVEIDHTGTLSNLVEDSLIIVSGGTGYSQDDLIQAVGGTVESNKNPTTFRVTSVDGNGSIIGLEVLDPGFYVPSNVGNFTNSPAGIYPVVSGTFTTSGGSGSNALLTATFLGSKAIYEVTTVEKSTSTGSGFDELGNPIFQQVLKLNLDSTTGLISDLYDGQIVSIRSLQKLRFTDVQEIKPVRPSTALEFQNTASGNQILRTLSYELVNSVGDPLPPNQAILSFDSNFNYALFDVDTSNLIAGYGLNAGDTKLSIIEISGEKLNRANSGQLIFFHQGRGHQITAYVPANTDGPNTPGYLTFTNLSLGQGSIIPDGIGLAEGFSNIRNTTIRAGISAGSTAFITVNISTCRASSHDFLDVGSGGYNDTNYPNNLYGSPANDPNKVQEVVEETQGRVFYVSTDQDGIFKVGRFFQVDQGTGNVTFNAAITLTDLNGIGFKKGTFVTEFSTDETLQDNDSNSVPVESAVRGYVDKRLGINHEGNTVPEGQRIGIGVVPLDGSLGMTGNLNMAGPNSSPMPYKIINLAPPSDQSDAATKSYVDTEVSKFDSLQELKDITLIDRLPGDLIAFNPNTSHITNSRIGGDVIANLDFSRPYSGTLQGGISVFPIVDAGIIGVGVSSVLGGIVVNEDITEWPDQGYIQINNEIFKYTNKTSASQRLEGITRGEFSTTPATHSQNAIVDYLSTSQLELLIGNLVIDDANVSNTAAILQSKLDLEIATIREFAPEGSDSLIQAACGIASFDQADFEVNNGFVSIKQGGIDLPQLQPIAAGTVLGNFLQESSSPQEVTTSGITSNGIQTLFVDLEANASDVLSRRTNGLNSTAFANTVGVAIAGSGTFTDIPGYTIPATGTGFGAKFTVNYSEGSYTGVVATYGGSNYQDNTQIRIDGSLLGGITGVNDLVIIVDTSNIDNNTYYSFQQTSVTAESNSIVKTDNNRNLGTSGEKFNNIFANNFIGSSAYFTGLLNYSVDSNVIAAGSTQLTATVLTKSFNNVGSGAGGVRLPSPDILGKRIFIRNETFATINIYPSVGSKIDTNTVNLAYQLDPNTSLEFIYIGITPGSNPNGQWVIPNAVFA